MITLKKHKKIIVIVAALVIGLAAVGGYVYSQQNSKTTSTDLPILAEGCGDGGYLYLVVHKETSEEAVKKAAKAVGGKASRDHYERPVYHISLDKNKEDAAIEYLQKQAMTEVIAKSSPTCTQ